LNPSREIDLAGRRPPEELDRHVNLAELLNQGHALHRAGKLADAEAVYRNLLQHAPGEHSVLRDLAWVSQQQGKHAAAVEAMQQAVQANPQDGTYWCDLGNMLRSAGNVTAAIEQFQTSIRLNANLFHPHFNLGNAYRQLNQMNLARDCYLAAARLAPHDVDVQRSLGTMHSALGEFAEARVCFERVLAIAPPQAESYINLGLVEASQGNREAAVAWYRRAVENCPQSALAYNQLGLGLRACNQLAEAIDQYQRAIAIDPRYTAAYRNLGDALEASGNTQAAIDCYESSLRQTRDDGLRIKCALTLPVIIESNERLEQSRRRMEQQLDTLEQMELRVDDPVQSIGTLGFSLAYHGRNERAHQSRVAALIRRVAPSICYVAPHCREGATRSTGRIRLGFVSAHLKNHTIGKLNAGLIERLDRQKFEVVVCRFDRSDDETTQLLEHTADRTIRLSPNLAQAQKTVAEQKLDAIVYTDIGIEPMSYYLAHARLAPVQCVTWGHPLTTGIPTLDYFISSTDLETAGADAHYTERLARLPCLANYYFRPKFAPSPKTRADLDVPERGNWYGCLQSLFKLHPDDDQVFASILRQDPDGYLILLAGNFPHWTELVRERFARSMPDVVDRVRFVPQQSPSDFAKLLSLCDVLLDPLHFGGGDTTYQSFAVGTPVVSLPGEFLRSRITHALYCTMGLPGFVAKDTDDYVRRAVTLASDKSARAQTSQEILTASDAIYENPAAVQALESFLLDAVHL
jgi:predicted O-linked N-acetylglucosamine transferase (SPINDLY family)